MEGKIVITGCRLTDQGKEDVERFLKRESEWPSKEKLLDGINWKDPSILWRDSQRNKSQIISLTIFFLAISSGLGSILVQLYARFKGKG